MFVTAMMLAIAQTATASPAFVSGNDLLRMCEAASRAECYGYVQGVSDVGNLLPVLSKSPLPFCTPDNVTVRQVADIVVKFLVAHPESRNQGAAGLTWVALAQAFPCSEGGPRG